jgi:hypothetical protein
VSEVTRGATAGRTKALMIENIETTAIIVKADDAQGAAVALSDTEFADRLEAIARDIDTFERTRRKMILRIAKLVSDAHDLFLYRRNEGGFTGWMKTRFDCSPSSAYRLLDVHKRFGNGESFPNWETLSDSALYLLAPPSVPKEALDVVAARVEAGENVSCAAVTEVIANAKGKSADSIADETDPAAADVQDNQDDEDPSVEQRRAEHAALFAEPADSAGSESTDEVHGTENLVNGSGSSTAELLLKVWDASTPEDQQFIRDLILEEFFAQASGADIYDRIPADRLDVVCRDFLDKLGVEGMRTRMSDEFGTGLRRQKFAPAERKKSARKWKKSINLPANSARNGRGHRSRH